MKETNDVLEFASVIKEDFNGLSIFDFIKLLKQSKSHKKAVNSGDVQKVIKAETMIQKMVEKFFPKDVHLIFDRNCPTYTVRLALPSKKSNMASGEGWGIPTGS